jgi:hypothetical protein
VIPVRRVRKPAGFDTKVGKPGKQWLQAHPKATRPKALWSPYLEHLASGFRDRCGYAAMLDPTGGTVDHYLSFRNHPDLAYEWSNYRFVSWVLNAAKKTADDAVLDPYQVRAGWFEILLPSLQMCITDRVPRAFRAETEYTLKRLKLRDGERIIRWRRKWYEMYQRGRLSLHGLRDVAPLIADAVERQTQAASAPKAAAKARKRAAKARKSAAKARKSAPKARKSAPSTRKRS